MFRNTIRTSNCRSCECIIRKCLSSNDTCNFSNTSARMQKL